MANHGNLNSSSALHERWFSPVGFTAALIAGLVVCFPGVMGGWEAFFYRDHGVLAFPSLYHLRAAIMEGEFPLWNPLSNCGAPFAAQWGPMVYYPGLWPFLALPQPQGMGWFCMVHLIAAGVGMYWLARQWTSHAWAASLAGWWYVFNGATFSCIMWPNYLVALAGMPWVVWSVERAWERGGRSCTCAGIIAALQVLSGVPELIALTWLTVGVFAVVAIWQSPELRRRMVLRVAGVIVLAAGLTVVQWLPFLELLAHSHRAGGTIVSKWAMPTWGLAHLVLPLYHAFETPEGVFYQHGQHFLSSYYAGILPVVLGVWALWWGRNKRVMVLAAITLVAYWLAMGDAGGLYAALKKLFPFLEIVRFPVKFVLLPAFLLPLLAVQGLMVLFNSGEQCRKEWLPRAIISLVVVAALLMLLVTLAARYPLTYDQPDVTRRNAWWRLLWLGAGLAGLLWMTHPRWGRWMLAGLMVVCLADVWTHAPRQNPTLPIRLPDLKAGLFEPGFWRLSQKSQPPRHGEGRIFITAEAEQSLLHASSGDLRERWFERRTAQWSHLNLLERIPKVNGSSTLQIREQRAVEDLFYVVHTNRAPEGLLNFLGVTYRTAPGFINRFEPRRGALPLITAGQKPVFLPRTNFPACLASKDFNPATMVYFPEEMRGQITVTQAVPARVEVREVRAHRLRFTVEAPAAAMVVVAQSYYPCWRARVDGATVPLWRANHAFQALAVNAGKHDVELCYQDRWFFVGLACSLLTLAALVFWTWRKAGKAH